MFASDSNHMAKFGSRTVAFAIDTALLAVLHNLIIMLPAVWLIPHATVSEPSDLLGLFSCFLALSWLSFIFLPLAYFTLFHAWTGQTIGKMIMGIRVVSATDDSISPAVAFLRWTGYILSAVPLAAGFLWAAVDKDHCAWHDRLARTRVVPVEMT